MRRRFALVIMAAVLAAAGAVVAQPAAGLPEVALLCSRFCFETPDDLHTHLAGRALLRGLESGGYVEGKNVVLSLRASGVGPELPRHAAELARRQPAVILAFQDDGIEAARRATSTTPIVMVAVTDAVEQGIVSSLARPGGNVTGVTVPTAEVVAKRLELLKEVMPSLTRVGVLRDPSSPAADRTLRWIDQAAARLGLVVQPLAARDEADFDAAFAALGPARPVGLLVIGNPAFLGGRSRGQLTQRALAGKVALVGPTREYVQSLALMSLEASRTEMFERAGALVAKVLRGARPADVPVEEPTRYELFISESAAKVLGLTIPASVRARAQEVLP